MWESRLKFLSNIAFQVLKFSIFVFNKCSGIIINRYICGSYNKSLNGFGHLCMRNAGLLSGHCHTLDEN